LPRKLIVIKIRGRLPKEGGGEDSAKGALDGINGISSRDSMKVNSIITYNIKL